MLRAILLFWVMCLPYFVHSASSVYGIPREGWQLSHLDRVCADFSMRKTPICDIRMDIVAIEKALCDDMARGNFGARKSVLMQALTKLCSQPCINAFLTEGFLQLLQAYSMAWAYVRDYALGCTVGPGYGALGIGTREVRFFYRFIYETKSIFACITYDTTTQQWGLQVPPSVSQVYCVENFMVYQQRFQEIHGERFPYERLVPSQDFAQGKESRLVFEESDFPVANQSLEGLICSKK